MSGRSPAPYPPPGCRLPQGDHPRDHHQLLIDRAARIAALVSNQVDLINGMTVDQLPQLGSQYKPIEIANAITAGFFIDSIDYRGNLVPEFADKRVRQALNYAVDKNAINTSFYGGRATVTGQLPVPATFGNNPAVQPYPFDRARARARQLLTDSGFANGFPMDMEARPESPECADVAVNVREQLDQVGVRGCVTQITDSALALEKFNGRAARAPLFGWLLGAGGRLFDADPQLTTSRGLHPSARSISATPSTTQSSSRAARNSTAPGARSCCSGPSC